MHVHPIKVKSGSCRTGLSFPALKLGCINWSLKTIIDITSMCAHGFIKVLSQGLKHLAPSNHQVL